MEGEEGGRQVDDGHGERGGDETGSRPSKVRGSQFGGVSLELLERLSAPEKKALQLEGGLPLPTKASSPTRHEHLDGRNKHIAVPSSPDQPALGCSRR